MQQWKAVAVGSFASLAIASSAALGALSVGCASTQVSLRAPLTEKCAGAGLQECPAMVDGVLAYVAGQSAESEEKIKAAAAKSPPEKVKNFAANLHALMDLPGAETSSARPIGEIIDLLSSNAQSRAPAGPPKPTTPPNNLLAQLAREDAIADQDARLAPPHVAGEDFRRIRTGTVIPAADSKGTACDGSLAATRGGSCAKVSVFSGPFVLTDLYAPGGCGDELFVYSDSDAARTWTILSTASQPLSLHGAQLVVAKEEKLYVGAKNEKGPLKTDPLRCSVTFSGWRPEFPGVHYLMLE